MIDDTDTTIANESPELLWADVGERLGLTVQEMRSLRTAFGDLLGLGSRKSVPEALIPVIGFISRQRRDGAPDDEISRRLADTKSGRAWPEQVLARMETASALQTPLPSMPPLDMLSDATLSTSPLFLEDELPDGPIRDMILDLRREIRSHFAKQRADIMRLDQGVRKLSLEVRDMRYALMLAFSRRDRKRGKKGISNLLLG